MKLFGRQRWTTVSAQVVSYCGQNEPNIWCSTCLINIQSMFDFLADPVVHLFLLKSLVIVYDRDQNKWRDDCTTPGRSFEPTWSRTCGRSSTPWPSWTSPSRKTNESRTPNFSWKGLAAWMPDLTKDKRDQNHLETIWFFKWAIPGIFFVYFRLFKQTLQFVATNMWKISIQYMVLGFKPTTFRT